MKSFNISHFVVEYTKWEMENMGLNFRKSIKIGKNSRINLSKSGIGVSTGAKGARIGVGPRGIRKTVSIPGTGIYATKQTGYKKLKQNSSTSTHTSAEWNIFAIILAIMIAIAIAMPALTIMLFGIVCLSFVGYLIIHTIRKVKK